MKQYLLNIFEMHGMGDYVWSAYSVFIIGFFFFILVNFLILKKLRKVDKTVLNEGEKASSKIRTRVGHYESS